MILSVKNLKKSYNDGKSKLEVLKDVSFDLKEETIGFVGRKVELREYNKTYPFSLSSNLYIMA